MPLLTVDSIVPPEDIGERLHAVHVRELASSIKRDGMFHPILVDGRTRRVVCGRDRLAAHLLLKRDTIEVRLVSPSDDRQAKRMVIEENLRRRNDDRSKLIAALSSLEQGSDEESRRTELWDTCPGNVTSETIAALPPDGAMKRGPRPIKAKARSAVASTAGVKPETVRKVEQRVAKREARPTAPPAPKAPPIRTLGLAVPQEVLDHAARMQAGVDEALPALRKARASVKGLDHQQLQETLKTAEWMLKQSRPACVCPHCKLRRDCTFCGDLRWIDEGQLASVDPLLLVEGDGAGVFVDGKFRLLSDLGGDEPLPF